MKKWVGKALLPFLMCMVGIAAVLIGIIYFDFISERIYEDSTDHLEEIYGQVNRSFGAFVERNWGLLDGWNDYIRLNSASPETVSGFIEKEHEYWGFSEFYFLSADETGMTIDGQRDKMDLGGAWNDLREHGEPVMAGDAVSESKDITVFAVPVEHGEYNGFGYDAVAVSYTNADMASSLNVDAFAGDGKCFVIHNDGSILLSTQTGGNVFGNYFMYLNAASDLDEQKLAKMRTDWENETTGLVQCKIGGVSHCILYQPVGYQDYILLSAVPQSVVSAGFLSVQKITMNVFIVIFLLLGAAVFALIVMRNRRQSRITRTELNYRERMFDVLSNNVDDIFIMLDSENQSVDYISPNIERLLGIPAAEVRENIRVIEKCAINFNVVIPKNVLEEIPLNGNKYWECEYMHQNTGERRWYRMTIYHMSIQDVKKYIVVMSDRTLEQQMNQKLQEALTAAQSANEAKSNFLSNMSHDIRTPMNAIVGFSVLLEKDADNAEKVREYTRKITASSHHLLSLINDVLDMSKIESGKTSLNVDRFNLPELLEELSIILMPQAKAKNQKLKIDGGQAPREYIIGDKLRLNQILINLLSNAVKYTPEGGKIEFIVRELPQTAQQYVNLQFVVRDNGIGMSEEFQKNVFAPFSREINSVTNKIQGTGLGMAITKNLVDLMGGIIRVKSKPGQGSTFTVELSFALAEQDDMQQPSNENDHNRPEPDENVMRGRRFLIAEDNELNAEILTEMLGMEGVICELAVNGEEAVKMFEKSEQGYYDMIFMDVQMPVMNGYEATRQIRSCGRPDAESVPIAAMTANTFAEDVRNAMDAGMNGHLAKPIDMDAVRKLASRLISGKESRSEKSE